MLNSLNKKIINLKFTITNFFNQRLFIELFYNKFISECVLKLGGQSTKILDKGSIEYIGPYGLEIGLLYTSSKFSHLDSGLISSYAIYILFGLIIYLFFPFFLLTNLLFIIIVISFFV